MSEFDEKAFRGQLARDTGDAVYNSWVILAEALIGHGVIKKEVLVAMLDAALNEVARTYANSITHYVLYRALESYSMDRDTDPGATRRPTWLRGVVDGGKDEA